MHEPGSGDEPDPRGVRSAFVTMRKERRRRGSREGRIKKERKGRKGKKEERKRGLKMKRSWTTGEGRSGPWWMQAERRLASSTFLNVRWTMRRVGLAAALDNQRALSSATFKGLCLLLLAQPYVSQSRFVRRWMPDEKRIRALVPWLD